MSPLGRRTVSGLIAGVLCRDGAWASKKWLDAPESKMAQLSLFFSVKLMVGKSAAAATPKREE